ncbi:MAG: sensor domain-containing diguanylate cyclase [Woeseiaceae bacterium]|nr:sensor domain-containing diguanylate cyclase [Woeseiaceae bacterium]
MSIANPVRLVEELLDEIDELKLELRAVKEQVATNEEKHHRSQQRELGLLKARDLGQLFNEMIAGLRDSYQLEYISVVLCDPDHDIRHLLAAGGSPAENIDGLFLVDALSGMAPQYVALRSPWLGPFAACDHQMLFPGAPAVQSVALIPLMHHGNLMGSINFGSASADRFTTAHASDFLAHLGVIASFCVENTVNRARLLRSGFTDALTGWHNRRYLQVRLKEELARARRDRTGLVCLMLDLDHFKRVNDTWGHLAGDAVLQEVAHRIDAQVRASDVAARYGGEEFIVLMPEADVQAGLKLAERIRSAVSSEPVALGNGETVTITVSVGIASVDVEPGQDELKSIGESLIARADVALYSAKSSGRDRVIVEGQ